MSKPLFDTDFLRKLECLSLIARQLVFARRQALRPSVKKGASIEFKDFRAYSPGDDPRTVDWMVYARLGDLFVKLFRQEEELDLWVLLDASGSMAFGDRAKFDHARRVAAALAYIGLAHMDSASVLPFAGELLPARERMRGKGQIFPLMDTLSALETRGKTDLERAVRMFISRVRRPGLVVVLSDFYGLEKARAALDRLRFMRHQIHVMQVVCPWELDPPLRGEMRLVDAESGAHGDITVTDTMLRRYKAAFQGAADALRRYSMQHAIGFEQASTSVAFDEFIRRLLQRGTLLA